MKLKRSPGWLCWIMCLMGLSARAEPAAWPNILWITTEDIGPHLGSYDDPDASTPHLDRLAAESVRFTSAQSPAGVCAPSRSSFITGLYASSLGSQHMRCAATLPEKIRLLPAYLRDLGFYCTNRFKEDYNFATPVDAWDESGREADWSRRAPGQPFFSVINFMTTHESRLRFSDEDFARLTQSLSPAQRHGAATVTLPAWLPDSPAVRREWARYHDLISAMDHEVGQVLARLEADGLTDDTIVFFFSDHGAGLPRAKQFVYEAGLNVPLFVHVPQKWQHLVKAAPGGVDDRLVSLVDLAPTILSVLGENVPAHMQGRVFLGPEAERRTHLAAIRDRMDERVDMTRTLRDERFKYHRNYLPHVPHFPWLDYMDLLDTAKAFREKAMTGELPPGLAAFMAPDKPLEELYDLRSDPDELSNLAADPAHAATMTRLREAHFDWVRRTRDTGFVPEQMLRDLSQGRSEYEFAQSTDYDLERILRTVRLLEEGATAVPGLQEALTDEYGPVRFWAATNLVALGESARPAVADLKAALDDRQAEVAIAAAEALCRLGEPGEALPVLTHHLDSSRSVVSLAAANVLDRIDAQALPVRRRLAAVVAADPGELTPTNLRLMVQWVLNRALAELDEAGTVAAVPAGQVELTQVGVASVDITPVASVRLHGFPRGERAQSVSAVTQPIRAQAIAIGGDEGAGPVLLVNAEVLGVSEHMTSELARRLETEAGFTDRNRLTLTANHNHSAPALSTVAPYVLRHPPSATEAGEISAYERLLMDRLVGVAKAALADRRPARLEHGMGQGDFAMNRRVVVDGKWTGFGDNPDGPVDHDLPVLVVRSPDGALRAVWLSYACHGVCWQKPSFHGDWMGVARSEIEATHPGVVVMVTIGCAGNINPLDRYFRGEDPTTPGRAAAAEVERLLGTPLKPLAGAPDVRLIRFELPLQETPDVAHWAAQKDWFSQTMLTRFQRNEIIETTLPFVAQVWSFSDDLAILFLAGEVHVEYGLQLKRQFDRARLWVNAYANAAPAYIPTAAELPEGGWEVDASRLNYGVPARLAPEAETTLLKNVSALIPAAFRADGKGASDDEWWKHTGHPKGKWWLTYPGYEGDAADKIWETVPIPPSPVLSPEDALASLVVDERFRVELVAAEPLVVRPVFMRFDEAGRLWVVEMPGYMRDIDGAGEADASGRVVVLEDLDGDGRMDRSTPFLEGLVMPRTLALVPGGVLVAEPPHIWLARDLDGDLVADEKIQLADDYGPAGNPEHSANGLVRAIDNWYYSAKSAVRYRFRGDRLDAEPTVFRGQWGISQDDTGRLFYNYNASPLHADLAPGDYFFSADGIDLSLRRNVHGPSLINVSLAEDKSLFPPRVTPLVTLGASDLRPDGTLKQFTAASSPFIYRGAWFPEDVRGDVFIADPVGNLVSHMDLTASGVDLAATRVREGREFLASTDERFRPVFLESGPDGALYIADMYTGIVEHKRYVTEYLRKQVLGRGMGNFTETGRIYRVVPVDRPAPARVILSALAPRDLVNQLDNPDGWVRDTAQRLLVQGNHTGLASALRSAASQAPTPLGRLHALWTLEGLARLDTATVRDALGDDDARVRAAAVRLSERLPENTRSAFTGRIRELLTDKSAEVRLQALLTLGSRPAGEAWPGVMNVLAQGQDWWLAPTTAAGWRGREMAFLDEMMTTSNGWEANPMHRHLFAQAALNLMHRGEPGEVAGLLERMARMNGNDWRGEAMWAGAAANEREGDPVRLSAVPEAYAGADESALASLPEKQVIVLGQVTWPGDPRGEAAAARPMTSSEQALFDLGRDQYALICAACHQPNGMGLTGVAPRLNGSEWVTGNPRIPVEIVLRGLVGKIEVKGESWNMVMPGLDAVPGLLDEEKVAAITTYIRRAWSNKASAVAPAETIKIRQLSANRSGMWTAEELQALPEFEQAEP